MELIYCLRKIFLAFIAFPCFLNCQVHTTGYAYQFISVSDESSSLFPELIPVYHNCWMYKGCKYIAKIKARQYIMLKSRKELENKQYDMIWKKRFEGIRHCDSKKI